MGVLISNSKTMEISMGYGNFHGGPYFTSDGRCGDVKKSDEILRMRKHFEVSFLRPGSQEEADGSLPEWLERL